MSKASKTLNYILNTITTIMIVLLFICLMSNFQTTFLGKKYNNLFGYALFEIKTASMSGTMEISDWILVKITDDVGINDIVTYEESGTFVTHRIVETYKDTIITRGDSNTANDAAIDRSLVVGKVIKVLPKIGIVKKTILNERVLILLIIAIFLGNSLFVKKDSNEYIAKIKSLLNIKEDNLKKIKKTKVHKVSKENNNNNNSKTDSNEKLIKKYPSLEAIKNTSDVSKTVILSKVVVDKSNNVKKIAKIQKEIQNEIKDEKMLDRQKTSRIIEIK